MVHGWYPRVEIHDGMLRFSEVFKPIVATLEKLELFRDIEISTKTLLIYNYKNAPTEFIIFI